MVSSKHISQDFQMKFMFLLEEQENTMQEVAGKKLTAGEKYSLWYL